MYTVGFIGIGSMGGALLAAVSKKLHDDIMVCDLDKSKVEAAVLRYGCASGTSADVAEGCRYVFLCMKPQAAEESLRALAPTLAARHSSGDFPILVSIMAGVTIETVQRLCGDSDGSYRVIRIMPNVAASVGEAMTLCAHTDNVGEAELVEFSSFMSESGSLDFIPERLIDAGMAVSGCGPAFVCLFTEALCDGAVACGVPRNAATKYALQTLIGTAKLMLESGEHPGVVKDAVCSPAGTTIAGVRVLEEQGFRSAVTEAVIAAFEKTKR